MRTIHVGGTPHFIITGLYPPVVSAAPPPQAPTATIIIALVACFLVGEAILVPLWFLWRRHKGRRS